MAGEVAGDVQDAVAKPAPGQANDHLVEPPLRCFRVDIDEGARLERHDPPLGTAAFRA